MTDNTNSHQGQFLTFTLGKEVFALDIVKVREVLELTAVSTIPRTPGYMKGVINLRGHAVPVIDMRLKLGMSEAERTVDTCIIIMDVAFENETIIMGTQVDSVREVIEMTENEIEPAPKMGASIEANYINGMGRRENQFIVIVDVDRIFSDEELQAAKEIKQKDTKDRAA